MTQTPYTIEQAKVALLEALKNIRNDRAVYEYDLMGRAGVPESRIGEEAINELCKEDKIETQVRDGDLWVRGHKEV